MILGPPISDLSDAMLEALRIPRSPSEEPLEQAIEALSRQPGLLVVDNFEQLLGKSRGPWESGRIAVLNPDSQGPLVHVGRNPPGVKPRTSGTSLGRVSPWLG